MSLDEFIIKPENSPFDISAFDADYTMNKTEDDVKNESQKYYELLSKLQHKLYAEGKRSILIILQGVDASGKDGVIRNVIKAFNPIGCRVDSFKAPTSEELSHDYLWRIHHKIPPKGMIGVFNRSHYEDIIEVSVQNLLPKHIWELRFQQINLFEKYLTQNNVIIMKFFLHISKSEQKKKLDDRIQDPTENWKVSMDDYEKRKKWNQYMKAYQNVINQCSTDFSRWHVIPSDKKWFRNWIISKFLVDKLDSLKMKFPKLNLQ